MVVSDLGVAASGSTKSRSTDIGGVRVTEVDNQSEIELERLVPGSGHLIDRGDAFAFPGSTAVVSTQSRGWRPEEAKRGDSEARISRFLRVTRLTTGSTVHALAAIWGSPAPVGPYPPYLRAFQHAGAMRMTHRPAELSGAPGVAIDRFLRTQWGGIDRAVRTDSDLGLAMARFDQVSTDFGQSFLDRLLLIAIGLESALGGPDGSDVGLRLRTRAAHLLGSDGDSADDVYDAVRLLYDVRSRIVHGDRDAVRTLLKSVPKLKTTVKSSLPGEQLDVVLDRYRELLRRAITARIALGAGAQPPWPWAGRTPDIDRALIDQRRRRSMQAQVRSYWNSRGLESAVRPSPAPSGLVGIPGAP
jgi:hypothetical protein